MFQTLFSIATLLGAGLAAPSTPPQNLETRGKFPFNKVVAFGDDYTDDGSGSFAHGITGVNGQFKSLWGANTWTDGPVAVTYLAKDLGMDLVYDYAWGSAGGGGVIGSVCNNSLLNPQYYGSHAKKLNGKLVPDVLHQIHNYSTNGNFHKDAASTLHFLWTGNNDMIASIGWTGRFTICDKDTLCHPGQQVFIKQLIACMEGALTRLLKHGAKYIIVPNVYPRNMTPWMTQYISPEAGMIADFGQVISSYNKALEAMIASLNKEHQGAKIMYYDANGFMQSAMKKSSLVQGAAHLATCVDGCPAQVNSTVNNFQMWWDHTFIGKLPDQFYWMTTVVASTAVMKALGEDMLAFLKTQF